MSAVPVGAEPARLLTPRFLTVVASGLCYFTALALVLPVLPQYVEGPLEGGSLSVGIAVGIFAFGAVVLRPYAGRIGDRAGRRVLIVGGALIVAATTLLYGVHASLEPLGDYPLRTTQDAYDALVAGEVGYGGPVPAYDVPVEGGGSGVASSSM